MGPFLCLRSCFTFLSKRLSFLCLPFPFHPANLVLKPNVLSLSLIKSKHCFVYEEDALPSSAGRRKALFLFNTALDRHIAQTTIK